MGQRLAKLQAKTMGGVIAKLLAAARHLNEDDLEDDAHAAVLAGAALDARLGNAYSDLEPKIRDLRCMAEIARYEVVNTFGVNTPGETEEEHRERGVAFFAALHLMDMVLDLEKAYDSGWSGASAQR